MHFQVSTSVLPLAVAGQPRLEGIVLGKSVRSVLLGMCVIKELLLQTSSVYNKWPDWLCTQTKALFCTLGR